MIKGVVKSPIEYMMRVHWVGQIGDEEGAVAVLHRSPI